MGIVYHEKAKYHFSLSWYTSSMAHSQEVLVRMIEEIVELLKNELQEGLLSDFATQDADPLYWVR
jgi:hypothetical protein